MQSFDGGAAGHDETGRSAQNLRGARKSVVMIVGASDDEDEPLPRDILVAAGYEVRTTPDGVSAVRMAQIVKPNLILLAATSAHADGYRMCGELKADDSTQHIPIILILDANDRAIRARGYELGAADFVTKPINAHTLRARIRTHLALDGQRRHLEGMFRDVIELAPDAFILADTQWRVVQINARAESLFGYSRGELGGMPLKALVPQLADGELSALEVAVAPVTYADVRCVRKDRSEFAGDINLGPMQTNRGRLNMAVVRDVSEGLKTRNDLAQSRQLLRELAAQNELMREQERKHIAREVHDELGQVLTALRMDMSLLDMQFGAREPALASHVKRMKKSVDRAIQAVRNVAANLRPTALDMGLVPAIEWLCSEFSELTSTPCVLEAPDVNLSLDEARNVVVFRIVQESLTNITRYAQASHVEMLVTGDGSALRVEVRDNGCGFDTRLAARKKSFGLLGMRERAIALGGRVDVSSELGRGTMVSLIIPAAAETSRDAQ